MTSIEVRAQIRACVVSDLDETAQRVWLLLFSRPSGVGFNYIKKSMGLTEKDVSTSLKILNEAGLIEVKELRGNQIYVYKTFRVLTQPQINKAKKAEGTFHISASQAALRLFQQYQERRAQDGVGHFTLTPKSRLDLIKLSSRLDEHPGTVFKQFLSFAVKRYLKFAGYPTPAHLCGDWIWGEWVNSRTSERAEDKKAASTAHAGKHYGEAHWAREQLVLSGSRNARTWKSETIIYIYDRAREVVDMGIVIEPTEKWKAQIAMLVTKLREAAVADDT